MSATRSNPQVVTVSDPTVARQLARTVAQEQATGSTNPVVVTNTETLFNQATASAANAAPGQTSTLTVTSSPANDVGDVVTVYRTTGGITVTAVNETVNQYTSVDSGVSQILAGTGVTITSTGASGTGVVTINSTGGANYTLPIASGGTLGGVKVGSGLSIDGTGVLSTTVGNIATTNYDGNASNVLHGDGTWSADVTDYGNSNVANYLPTYTGNISGDYLVLTHDVDANVVTANYLYGDGSNITNLPVGNIATINLDGNASNALLGNGTWGPVEVTGSSIANGSSNITIPVANGNITLNAGSGQWLFDTAGRLEFPGGTAEITSSANYFGMWANGAANTNGIEFNAGNNAFLSTDGSFQLDTNVANGIYSFVFGNDGLFTLPSGNTKIGFQYGSDAILTSNSNFGVATQGANVTTFMNWSDDVANTSVLSAIYVNAPNANPGDVHIRTGNIGSPHVWKFNNDGNLGLPDGNSVIQSVPNNAGDLSGLSTLNLYPDSSTGDDRYLIVDPTGPNHLHIRAGGAQDASSTLLYLGGEQTYVQIDDGYHRVSINSYDAGNATGYNWRFDFDGNLVLPGNTTAINFANGTAAFGNVSGINLDGNVSNVLRGDGTWAPDAAGSYGDSNVTTLLGAFGSNTIVTTGIITADGANLSNVPYSNLTGAPTLGNISSINLDGNSQTWLAGNGVFANIAIPSVGNIAVINLDGNVSNVLRGDGTWGADANSAYGDSNVTSLLGAFGSNTIVTTGIITADGANLSNVPYANLTGAPTLGNIASVNLDGNVSNVLAGNGTFVALPVINANTVVWSTAPVANTSNGTAGQAAYDSGGNLYVCVATDTWAKFTGTTSW